MLLLMVALCLDLWLFVLVCKPLAPPGPCQNSIWLHWGCPLQHRRSADEGPSHSPHWWLLELVAFQSSRCGSFLLCCGWCPCVLLFQPLLGCQNFQPRARLRPPHPHLHLLTKRPGLDPGLYSLPLLDPFRTTADVAWLLSGPVHVHGDFRRQESRHRSQRCSCWKKWRGCQNSSS